MTGARILEFPAQGRVVMHEGDPDWDALSINPSPECIEKIEEMNRRNATAFLRRHFIFD